MEDRLPESPSLIRQSMFLAVVLFLMKTAAGLHAGSLSILASALDSLMDLCASAVNYVSLAIARSPADTEHQYGHGKAEALASLFQGAFIAMSGLALLAESARRVWRGVGMNYHFSGLAVMLVSTALSAFHSARLQRAARLEESRVMGAEGAHFLMDVAANLGVVAALLLVRWTGWMLWDQAVTAAVVGYILYVSVPIVLSAVSELMDEGLPAVTREEIEGIIRSHHPSVAGFHEFRSRRAGNRRYIEFHLELRGVKEFLAAHEISESLVKKIQSRLPNSDVLIHQDPEDDR